jgi:glucosamine 6-phosphate synthetase-like amidotransferase/phosphosugar isomerase protein
MAFYSPNVFEPGFRLRDGSQNNLAEGNPQVTTEDGIVATGTNLATARALRATFNLILTVGANTGVALPKANPGLAVYVFNTSATALTVYAQTGDTVDTAASVALTGALRAVYFCITPGLWISAQLGVVSA